jgi:hypothetical protein
MMLSSSANLPAWSVNTLYFDNQGIPVTHRFKLEEAGEAYRVVAEDQSGNITIVFK